VIEALIEATRHPNPQVRFRALWVLAATHAPGACATLLALTRDPDAAVRYDAAMALGRFGYVEAVEPLVNLVRQGESEDSLGSAAGTSLQRLGRPAVLPVIGLLQHEDPNVRHVAVNVLGGIRDERAVDPLVPLLWDPDEWVRKTAVNALEEIGDPSYWSHDAPRPSKGSGNPRTIERCFDLIADCGDDPDEWVRQQAAFWRRRGYGKLEGVVNGDEPLRTCRVGAEQ
jgi:HEAT repeat protein